MLSTKKIGGKLGKYIIFIFLAVFCVVLSVTTSGFLTEKNIHFWITVFPLWTARFPTTASLPSA